MLLVYSLLLPRAERPPPSRRGFVVSSPIRPRPGHPSRALSSPHPHAPIATLRSLPPPHPSESYASPTASLSGRAGDARPQLRFHRTLGGVRLVGGLAHGYGGGGRQEVHEPGLRRARHGSRRGLEEGLAAAIRRLRPALRQVRVRPPVCLSPPLLLLLSYLSAVGFPTLEWGGCMNCWCFIPCPLRVSMLCDFVPPFPFFPCKKVKLSF